MEYERIIIEASQLGQACEALDDAGIDYEIV